MKYGRLKKEVNKVIYLPPLAFLQLHKTAAKASPGPPAPMGGPVFKQWAALKVN